MMYLISALEVSHFMRYTNLRLTYLLTFLVGVCSAAVCNWQTTGACDFDELRIVEEGDDALMSRTTNLASTATNNGGMASQRPASSSALLDTCVVNNHSISTPMYSSFDSIITNEFSSRPC